MLEVWNSCLASWRMFWGDGLALIPVAVGLLSLGLLRKGKRSRDVLIVCLILALIFFLPPTAWFIFKCIGESVYWRVLWTIPFVPLTAVGLATLVRRCKKGLRQVLVAILLAVCILLTGQSFTAGGNYERTHNYQQIPDEVAVICDIINQKRKGKEAVVAMKDRLCAYVRVYDATLSMPYGRARRDYVNKSAARLYRALDAAPNCDYKELVKYCRKVGLDYLVIDKPTKKGKKYLKKSGFRKIGAVNEFNIYIYRSSKDKTK